MNDILAHDILVAPGSSDATKIYLAGPMTGYPKFNFPLFDQVAAELRAMASPNFPIEVVSPAELDDPKSRAAALQSEWGDPEEYARLTGLSWADFLSRDVKLIADGGFNAIVALPGWRNSRGARLETFVGHLCGIYTHEYTEGLITKVSIDDLGWVWTGEVRVYPSS